MINYWRNIILPNIDIYSNLKGGKTTMRKKLSMFIVSLTILTALVGTSTAFAKTTPQPTKIIVIQPMRIEPPM